MQQIDTTCVIVKKKPHASQFGYRDCFSHSSFIGIKHVYNYSIIDIFLNPLNCSNGTIIERKKSIFHLYNSHINLCSSIYSTNQVKLKSQTMY